MRGLRRVEISAEFIELLLTGGVDAAAPSNVPKDLRIISVRFFSLVNRRFELLVSSEEFDGGSEDSWGCPVWYPVFKKAGA